MARILPWPFIECTRASPTCLPIATSSADIETQYLKSQGCRSSALFQLVTK